MEMRETLATGLRQINLLMIPAAAIMIVLATPIIRLVYQHGSFSPADTTRASTALFWFAFSLPFGGVNLLLTRTCFALQRPWIPTRYAAMNMVVDIIVSVGLYKPLGIAGLVIGTAVANAVMTMLLLRRLTIGFNGHLDGAHTWRVTLAVVVAAVIMAAVARGVWAVLDGVLGGSSVAQVVCVGAAIVAAGAVYARLVLGMRIAEARQVQALVLSRVRRG
jgi:putative peptidoglycan lipid II flippase